MAFTTWRSTGWLGSIAMTMLFGACKPGDDGDTSAASETTTPNDACEMCGETPCHPGGDDCFREAFCVPPADDACVACMMTHCPDSVGASCGSGGSFDCVDYAKTIGGCGDAIPYAEQHYECMAQSCAAECSPGQGFAACACI
jgi:hypothetical protein